MSYKIIPTRKFFRQCKKLSKKYVSLKMDLGKLETKLKANPKTGTHLGQNVYKIRLNISSKTKGKSGGARVITYVTVIDTTVYLLNIYDKSERVTLNRKEIKQILKETGLSR